MKYSRNKILFLHILISLVISIVIFLLTYIYFEKENNEAVERASSIRRIKFIGSYVESAIKNDGTPTVVAKDVIDTWSEFGFDIKKQKHNPESGNLILESKIIKTKHISYRLIIFLSVKYDCVRNYFMFLQNMTDGTITIPDEKIIEIRLKLDNNENISISLR